MTQAPGILQSTITRLRADAPQLAAGRKREVTAPKPWRRRVSRSGGVPLDFVTDAPQLAAGSFTFLVVIKVAGPCQANFFLDKMWSHR
ncbi:MAG: hypothetical protein A2170_01150 [Deltaproteobacteria bacterium RBG_13_53_10]|nr:MAG: hypothetical protein A2170_01150 [Deltaproteobacteria bacterium RBG_13_53_10]